MNNRQRWIVSAAGGALALGLIFNRPIIDTYKRLTSNDQASSIVSDQNDFEYLVSYNASYTSQLNPQRKLSPSIAYRCSQKDLDELREKEKSGLIKNLRVER